ncbi:MAG: hypothetical protein ABIP20_07390 [Chthoniobacteraceae bacterium]
MTLTRDEIEERKEQLRQEILERECLLAALEVLSKYVAANRGCNPVDVGALLPGLLAHPGTVTPTREIPLLESAPAALPPPAPRVPIPPVHPELQKLGGGHGVYTAMVQWAIGRLTGDYTLQDIHAVLTREGRALQTPEISVILSRLKKRRQIIQIHRGNGRTPSIFRKPPLVSNEPTEAAA